MCIYYENTKIIVHVLLLQGVDLPTSDDPRKVVQDIIFGERQSVLGRKVMDVVCSFIVISIYITQMCSWKRKKKS